MKISIFQLCYPHILILQQKINSKRLNPTWQVVLGSNCGHFFDGQLGPVWSFSYIWNFENIDFSAFLPLYSDLATKNEFKTPTPNLTGGFMVKLWPFFWWSVRTSMELQLNMKFWKYRFFSFFTLISWFCNKKWIQNALTQFDRWF